MHADYAGRTLGVRGQRGDRDRRSVACENRLRRRRLIETVENLRLEFEILGGCFDGHVDVEIFDCDLRTNMRKHRSALLFAQTSLFYQPAEISLDCGNAALDASLVAIYEHDGVMMHRRNLSDAGPHLSGTHDRNF